MSHYMRSKYAGLWLQYLKVVRFSAKKKQRDFVYYYGDVCVKNIL